MNISRIIYTRQDIADRIRPVAKKYPINRVYLFGSYVRGSADESSDVDLCIETDKGTGIFTLSGIRSDFSEVLNKDIDLITESSLKYNFDRDFVDSLNEEKVCIYER